MRTGTKTLLKKFYHLIKKPGYRLKLYSDPKFPEKPVGKLKAKLLLYTIGNELHEWNDTGNLGLVHNTPHPFVYQIYRKLLRYNPNNIGNWSVSDSRQLAATHRIENLLTRRMASLYGDSKKEFEGYVTSGGTESVLYLSWIGKKSLLTSCKLNEMCLIYSDLSHYSFIKSADILSISPRLTKLNRKTWSVDPESLKKEIIKLNKKGYKGFIIPLTLGYSQTGTNDDISEIINVLKMLKKTIKVEFFVYIDAALSGLVLPFVDSHFKPLANPIIQGLSVDFHKFGMTPLSCGLVLYRGKNRKLIENNVAFMSQKDNTLTGSRSGITPISAYIVSSIIGKSGFIKLVEKSLVAKNSFLRRLKGETGAIGNVEIVNTDSSLSIGLVSKKKLPDQFLNKYGLYSSKKLYRFTKGSEMLYIYKASFLADSG